MRKRATAAVSGLRRRLSSSPVEAPSVPTHFNLLPEAQHWPNSGRVGEQRLMLVQYWRQMQGAGGPELPARAPVRAKGAIPLPAPPDGQAAVKAEPAAPAPQPPATAPVVVAVAPAPLPATPAIVGPIPTLAELEALDRDSDEPAPAVSRPNWVSASVLFGTPDVAPAAPAAPATSSGSSLLRDPAEAPAVVLAPTAASAAFVAASQPASHRTFVIDSQASASPVVARNQTPVEIAAVAPVVAPEPAEVATTPSPVVAPVYDEQADEANVDELLAAVEAAAPPVVTVPAAAADASTDVAEFEVDIPAWDLPAAPVPMAAADVAEPPPLEMHFELSAIEPQAMPVGEDLPVEEQDIEMPATFFAEAEAARASARRASEPAELDAPVADDLVFELETTPVAAAGTTEAPALDFNADALVQADRAEEYVAHTVVETFDADALSGSLSMDEPVEEASPAASAFVEAMATVELDGPVFEEEAIDVAADMAVLSATRSKAGAADAVLTADAMGDIVLEEPVAESGDAAAYSAVEEPVIGQLADLAVAEPEAQVVEPARIESRTAELETPFEFELPSVVEAPAVAEAVAEPVAPVVEVVETVARGTRADLSDGGRAGTPAPAQTAPIADPVWNEAKTEWTVSARDIRQRRSGVLPMPPARPAPPSPLPALERFLRRARARRERVAAESVA